MFSSVYVCMIASFPSLYHCPVFDRLQYAKTEGEGLEGLIMCKVI